MAKQKNTEMNGNELDNEIGTKEMKKIEAKPVTIVAVTIQEVGEKKARKVSCEVKHPDLEDTINISAVKTEIKKKLDAVGLWYNTDEDGKIRKGSALALFLQLLKAKSLRDLEGKEVQTTEDDQGYLVFKGY